MKRYRFRLDSVLRVRELTERQAEENYLRAQRMVVEAEMKIREQEQRRSDAQNAARAGKFDADRLNNADRFFLAIGEQIAVHAREREAAGIVAEVMRLELVEARQAREALTKLREKDYAEYRALTLKQEQEAIDEMATLRFGREY